ncbi:hypothetical protein R3P38DRAFT_3172419 [Favolaschia claudopus]|uniref:Uncharacterized protein n=1 Tax=Favolaschia claudopus TaxID=2862362 RepID=A0AAW0DKV7_9AGAR
MYPYFTNEYILLDVILSYSHYFPTDIGFSTNSDALSALHSNINGVLHLHLLRCPFCLTCLVLHGEPQDRFKFYSVQLTLTSSTESPRPKTKAKAESIKKPKVSAPASADEADRLAKLEITLSCLSTLFYGMYTTTMCRLMME